VKLNASGSLDWARSYHDASYTNFEGVRVADDGGILLVGAAQASTFDHYGQALAMKVDDSGVIQWQRTYRDRSALQTITGHGGGLLAAGVSEILGRSLELWIIKIDDSGQLGAACTQPVSSFLQVSNITPPVVERPYQVAETSASAVSTGTTKLSGPWDLQQDCIGNTNTPPSCELSYPEPAVLWPANHQMRPISIRNVTDPDGDLVSIQVDTVAQDEPTEGLGDGDTSPDAARSPFVLRAERSGLGDGRVYHIQFSASDGEGGVCSDLVTVCVPHDRATQCVDQGALFPTLDH
jgi:hypothetical protein